MAVLIIDCYIGLFGTCFMQVLYLGRAPCTKETLPDFREKCRVTRHSRVFRELMGSQRTPGKWGVTPYTQHFVIFLYYFLLAKLHLVLDQQVLNLEFV